MDRLIFHTNIYDSASWWILSSIFDFVKCNLAVFSLNDDQNDVDLNKSDIIRIPNTGEVAVSLCLDNPWQNLFANAKPRQFDNDKFFFKLKQSILNLLESKVEIMDEYGLTEIEIELARDTQKVTLFGFPIQSLENVALTTWNFNGEFEICGVKKIKRSEIVKVIKSLKEDIKYGKPFNPLLGESLLVVLHTIDDLIVSKNQCKEKFISLAHTFKQLINASENEVSSFEIWLKKSFEESVKNNK